MSTHEVAKPEVTRGVLVTRVVLGLAGAGLLGYGVLLGLDFVLHTDAPIESGLWLVGGTVLHDAVVAPVVGVVGWLIVRLLPRLWRAPVGLAVAATAILTLIAAPELVRPYPAPGNPGLHDRNYLLALALTVAVVWLVALAVGAGRTIAAHRAVRRAARAEQQD